MAQEKIFLQKEGDAYFSRNKSDLVDGKFPDPVLYLVSQYGIKAKKVLDIGCSNGSKLAAILEASGGKGTGVEPGAKAIADGKKRFPKIDFRRGVVSELPVKGTFDLVSIMYVMHWVSRGDLLKAVSEIDRVVADGGYLIIGDFDPNTPAMRRYHHLPSDEVYTYKQDYAAIFAATQIYQRIAQMSFTHAANTFAPDLHGGNRGVVTLLRKDLTGRYLREDK